MKGFKSYYVVWKHKMQNKESVDDSSLNRTMQYGNTSVKVLFFNEAFV